MTPTEEIELVRRMLSALIEQSRFAECVLDNPDDRLYHDADGTWWRREGNRLFCADPPKGWSKEGGGK